MGIILFLVDTSASMNQKTYLGASYLDVAKVAIETFLKVWFLYEYDYWVPNLSTARIRQAAEAFFILLL